MVEEKKIPDGYKETEVGIIPNDWNLFKLKDVSTGFMSGATPYREIKRYYKGNIKWVTSGELNYNIIFDTIEKITEEARLKTNLSIIPKGTFLMAITGLEAAGTRGSCGILGTDATTNQSCMAIFPTKYLITQYLFYYYIYNGDELAFKYCQGTKQQSYTARIVKELPIIIPSSIEEQQAIATALSDIDNLISSLKKLINKKKLIKQGAIQELLTGKKRLDGFSREWEFRCLGDLAEIKTGSKNTEDRVYNGKYPFFVRSQKMERIDTFAYDEEAILTAGDGVGVGKVFHYINGKFNVHQRVYKMSNFKGVYPKFFFEYFKENFYSEVMKYTAKSSVDSVRRDMIDKMLIPVPNVEEQKQISQILSDMDNEIEKLQLKLNKYKNIKRGMMEELLTGKRRLI